MKTDIIALLTGWIFGLGLAVSEMTDPARVVGFLDVAGEWDPTLLLVMGGAIAVTLPGFFAVLSRSRPLAAEKFYLPDKKDIDTRLMAGAAIFGAGWGLAGFCPGPALVALSTLSPEVLIFVAAMLVGQLLASLRESRSSLLLGVDDA
jgi:uncharacterized membrane protein YedE/YeeE